MAGVFSSLLFGVLILSFQLLLEFILEGTFSKLPIIGLWCT